MVSEMHIETLSLRTLKISPETSTKFYIHNFGFSIIYLKYLGIARLT
jgi:hypothetical protein